MYKVYVCMLMIFVKWFKVFLQPPAEEQSEKKAEREIVPSEYYTEK